MKCQNVHLLLKGINTYRNVKKLTKHSVTGLLRSDPKNDTDTFPEYSDTKEVNYYLFESIVETYTKDGKTTEHTRTARADKKKKYAT